MSGRDVTHDSAGGNRAATVAALDRGTWFPPLHRWPHGGTGPGDSDTPARRPVGESGWHEDVRDRRGPMNYRLNNIDMRVRRLIEQVEEIDPELAAELWDAVWAQVMRAASLSEATAS